jgi:hypothetical protein|tara:strand:- start:2988 stop:3314 length:327 start_codon:yes stop_codon:yes gene_type:complete
MIEVIFQFGGDIILVKIEGNNINFGTVGQGAQMAPIDGLKLSKGGVEEEFPDLVGNPEWREEAIVRFKDEIKCKKGEKSKAKYIIDDLAKHGYVAKRLKQNGYREEKL